MSDNKKVIILGATGGCVDILDAINDVNAALPAPELECVGLLDDNESLWGKQVLNSRVLGPFDSSREYLDQCYFVTGIGSAANFLQKEVVIAGLDLPRNKFATIVHPTANVSSTARLGYGCVISQHVTVATNVVIGDHVHILPNTVVSHDGVIEDYSIIAAGVSISGYVRIGKSCYVGTNSAFRESITVLDYCQVGMGSVVLNDVPASSVVVGNPARFLRHTREV